MNFSRILFGLRPVLCRTQHLSSPSLLPNTFPRNPAILPHLEARPLSSKPPKIDKSRVPELREEDLEEKFICGWGPGGQSINKTASAVYLRHIPTGLSVKCQKHRGQHQNRAEARLLLQERWDELLNGDDSVTAQRKRLLQLKSAKKASKTRKKRLLKEEWKKSLEDSTNKDEPESSARDENGTDRLV